MSVGRYVKVYLLPDRSKSGKRKTKVKKHTLNPLFEEILKVSVTLKKKIRRYFVLALLSYHLILLL